MRRAAVPLVKSTLDKVSFGLVSQYISSTFSVLTFYIPHSPSVMDVRKMQQLPLPVFCLIILLSLAQSVSPAPAPSLTTELKDALPDKAIVADVFLHHLTSLLSPD